MERRKVTDKLLRGAARLWGGGVGKYEEKGSYQKSHQGVDAKDHRPLCTPKNFTQFHWVGGGVMLGRPRSQFQSSYELLEYQTKTLFDQFELFFVDNSLRILFLTVSDWLSINFVDPNPTKYELPFYGGGEHSEQGPWTVLTRSTYRLKILRKRTRKTMYWDFLWFPMFFCGTGGNLIVCLPYFNHLCCIDNSIFQKNYIKTY